MKKYLFLLMAYAFVAVLPLSAQPPLMRDIFAAMPDSVLPMVTRNNRLDCIDFIENNMEARVRNRVDQYVTLEALSDDYARFRTSPSHLMEMKLLPLESPDAASVASPSDTLSPSSAYVLCIVSTAQSGEEGSALRLEDSNIRFLRPDWSALPQPITFTPPSVESFVSASAPADSLQTFESACRSLGSIHPLRMQLSADAPTLTLTLQTALLERDEQAVLRQRLSPVVMHWRHSAFLKE